MTGIHPKTAELVIERDGKCPIGVTHEEYARVGEQIHHRKPRGMGGTKNPSTNAPANLIYICATCHAWVESNRLKARAMGWLISNQEIPSETPLMYAGVSALLTDDGRVMPFVAMSRPEPA